jgi:hypothetical protein
MSVRALIETVVNLDSFLNVDLYCQGYYFVRLRLYSERPDLNMRIISNPHTHYLTKSAEKKELGINCHSSEKSSTLLIPSYIPPHFLRKAETCKKDNTYCSKVFYVRYSEENVQMGEIICFKTEIESDKDISSYEFMLEVELHFWEATSEEIANNSIVKKSICEEDLSNFKQVSIRKLGLKYDVKNGFFNYYPIVFD